MTMRPPAPPVRAPILGLSMVIALAALLALAACSDDGSAPCPTFQVGAVEGYVRVAGSGASVGVGARALDGANAGDLVASTISEATGRYRLDLPTGRYRLEIDPVDAHIWSSDARDTLTVTPRVLRHDVLRGRAELSLALPGAFEGVRFSVTLRAPRASFWSSWTPVTDGVLRAVFPVLTPGTYAVSLSPQCGYGESDSLRVGTESVAVRSEDYRSTAATIAGHVTGGWQQAQVSVPSVAAVDVAGHSISSADCDTDGAFELTLLRPSAVRLSVSIDGRRQWLGGDTFASARVFEPGPGDRLAGADFVESGLDLRLDGTGDWIVQQANILVRDADGRDIVDTRVSAARAVISNLLPGRYYVRVEGDCHGQGWAPQWYGGAEDAAEATPVDLAEGELRRLDFALVSGGRVEGQLLTASGGLPGAFAISLCDADGRLLCPSDYRVGGLFSFAGLADGDYLLWASSAPGDVWWYPGTRDHLQAAAITIAGHAAVTGLTWRLPEEPGKVQP